MEDGGALAGLLPPGLAIEVALGLVGLSFVTSALAAIAGLGGGLILIAVMANVLPAVVVVPVHGVVQLGSNAGRAWLLRARVERRRLAWFAAGSALGAALGAPLVVALPAALLEGILGAFVLYAVWAPRLRPASVGPPAFAAVGAVTTFLTLFLGATGPFVGAWLSPERLGRERVVATHAACMSVQHALKGIAFGLVGFAFAPWAALIVAMIASGLLGTVLGRRVLARLPERVFALLFRAVLTVLAVRLLVAALL